MEEIKREVVASNTSLALYSWQNDYMSVASNEIEVGNPRDDYGNPLPTRMYINMTMPTLPNNPRIKKAELELTGKSTYYYGNEEPISPKIGVYSIVEDVAEGTAPYEYHSTLTKLLDYIKVPYESKTNFKCTVDVTALIDEYYSKLDQIFGTETVSTNIMLKLFEESNNAGISFYGNDGTANAPKLTLTYEPSYSVNTHYRTHTHSLGRFGTASVDLLTGNLMFEAEDINWSGKRMPVTIKRLYTSALWGSNYTASNYDKLNTADFSAMDLGYGWKLNIMQSMIADTQKDIYYYTDANGEEYIFVKDEAQSTECTEASQCTTIYVNQYNNNMTYNPDTRIMDDTIYEYLFDTAGRLIKITDKNKSDCNMSINYVDGRITTVTDGAGRSFAFEYGYGYGNAKPLISITAPDSSKVIYDPQQDVSATIITYPDGSKATTYSMLGTHDKYTEVTLSDENDNNIYYVTYELSDEHVSKITEYGYENGSQVKGVTTTYEYSAAANRTVVQTTEPKDTAEGETADTVITTVYSFDDDGNISSQYAYSNDIEKTGVSGSSSGIHPYASGMNVVSNINNLVSGHSFEDLSKWSSESGNAESFYISNYENEDFAKFGSKVMRLQSDVADCVANGVKQASIALPAGEYTFSSYVRVMSGTEESNGLGAYIRVTASDGAVLGESEHITVDNGDYIRLCTHFTATEGQSVTMHLLLDGAGVVYFDGVQLENNDNMNPYNILENGNFELDMESWGTSNGEIASNNSFNMTKSFRVMGIGDMEEGAMQTVAKVKKAAGTRETFTLSGWANAYSMPYYEHEGCGTPKLALEATINYVGDNVPTEIHTAEFAPATDGWQFASVTFAKQEFLEVSSITVYCKFDYNEDFAYAYFDNIQLVRNSIETGLSESDFHDNTPDAALPDETAPQFEEATDDNGNAITGTTFADGEY
ncbi:MAG: DUF6531 domain-containing protein, partial [Acutalibacteraceae bacterium]|nr:DUF6531 domain-containing protein [Acutalibacteraceae bacterium]